MRFSADPKERTPPRMKDAFLDLCHAKPALHRLKGHGKPYDKLIEVLLGIGEEDSLPLGKDLQQQLDLTASGLRRWVTMLHEDFLTVIAEEPDVLQFPAVEHHFLLEDYTNNAFFTCRLSVTPRVGEEVEVPFLRHYAGSGSYHVHRVVHRYEEDRTIITVWLQTGQYNQHYEYLKDRAAFESAVDFRTLIMGNRHQIEKILLEEYPNG
jgi:hypothetical protein